MIEIDCEVTAPDVSMLAQMLDEEGLTALYEPPQEQRGGPEVVETMKIVLYVGSRSANRLRSTSRDTPGTAAIVYAANKAVARFRKRVPQARAEIIDIEPLRWVS